MRRSVSALPQNFGWSAQQFLLRDILGEFGAQKSFVGSVLEQTANEIRHAAEQLADRTIFANAIAQVDKRTLDRAGHAVEQLELTPARRDLQLVRDGLRGGDAAHVVRAECRRNDRMIFQQDAAELFEIGVALGFLLEDGNGPAVARRAQRFVIPVSAFNQAHAEARPARATPLEKIDKIFLGLTQIRL